MARGGGRRKKPTTAVEPDGSQQRITDYFCVRRSSRRPTSEIKKEAASNLASLVAAGDESSLVVYTCPIKGRGVRAGRPYARGEFVVEYKGDLVARDEAKRRELGYARDEAVGCYVYYFECAGKRWCVDATRESPYLGRLVNHSMRRPNMRTQALMLDGRPRLILVALRDIKAGEELLYDYGERSKEAVQAHPWLLT